MSFRDEREAHGAQQAQADQTTKQASDMRRLAPGYDMGRDGDGNVVIAKRRPLATLNQPRKSRRPSIWRRLWDYFTGPCA